MFCRNCGNQLGENAVICVKCGVPVNQGNHFCARCGAPTAEQAVVCTSCGCDLRMTSTGQRSKLVAGLLGIFVGWLGVHNFYLGYTGKGIAQIILSFLSCGLIGYVWGLIEGILILCGNIKYDADGNLLKD